MRKTQIVRLRGLTDEIIKIMSSGQWMTSGMVASQIIWPPEVAYRDKTKRLACGGRNVTVIGAQSGFVARILSGMFKCGKAERRPKQWASSKIAQAKYEYRLKVNEKKPE